MPIPSDSDVNTWPQAKVTLELARIYRIIAVLSRMEAAKVRRATGRTRPEEETSQ